MKIGMRIKQRRQELGLSVDEVASKLGKNRATVYRYENNDIENLPTTVLEPLALILETTPAYLLGWESQEEMERAEQMLYIEQQIAIENLGAAFGDKEIDHMKLFVKLSFENQQKVISYSKKLYDIQSLDSEQDFLLQAAHKRTDIEPTKEMRQNDNDIMNDPEF